MSEKKYNVDSFNLDHTKVFAPFVRKAATKVGAKGDVVTKFDIRLVALEKLDVLDSTEVQIQDLVDLKFTFPSVTNDATSNVNVKFEEAFKKRFNTSPNRFAIRGFDVTMDVISRMMQDDDNGENIFGYGSEQIENKFTYVNENGGIFNSGIYVLYYDKDLTIKEAQ